METIDGFVKNKNFVYKSWLLKYFNIVGIKPEQYFKPERDYDKDLLKFAETVKDKGWSPNTIKSSVACVKTYFMVNDVEIKPSTKIKLRGLCKGPSKTSKQHIPTRDELKQILSFGGVLSKSLFLMISSSGMRPNESVNIKLSDLYLEEKPPRIYVDYQYTRTKQSRNTFVSSECKEWLKQWLKVRNKYILSGKNKNKPDDKRLFPMSNKNAQAIWNNLLDKSGFNQRDTKTKHRLTSMMMLRKFFKTQLSDAGMPPDLVEFLMGHISGIRSTYRDFTIKQLGDWYLKCEGNLMVYQLPTNIEQIEDIQNKLDTLTERFKEFNEFRERVSSIELRDEDGDIITNGDGNIVYGVDSRVPISAIEQAFKLEKENKLEKLTKLLGDRKLAKKLLELRDKE